MPLFINASFHKFKLIMSLVVNYNVGHANAHIEKNIQINFKQGVQFL